jgi:phosphoglycerate kinase
METLPYLKPQNLKVGQRVLLRLDLNVPIKNGKVGDTFRIEQALRTLQTLQKKKVKTIVLSHLGDAQESLGHVVAVLAKKIKNISFVPYVIGDRALHAVDSMKNGDILVLENLRSQPGEEDNAPSFARGLARFGDIFIQDGFAVAHRRHASIVGLPTFLPSVLGPEFQLEIKGLEQALEPKRPSVLILGGAKFSTKLPILKKYMKTTDIIILGGAIAHNVLKARGVDVGMSLVDTSVPVPTTITKADNIIVPLDALTESGEVVDIRHVGMRDKIVDIGPATVALIAEKIKNAKTVVMNGPLGLYEEGNVGGTKAVLKHLALVKGETVVGGGDTVALARQLKLDKKIDFISTGGGAMLDYLTNGTLPGIEAVKKSTSQKK